MKLSLRLKLITAFLFVAMLVTGASLYTLHGIRQTQSLLLDIIDNDFVRIDSLQHIKFLAADIQRDALEYGQGINHTHTEGGIEAHMLKSQDELQTQAKTYRELEGDDITEQNRNEFEQIVIDADQMVGSALQLVANKQLTVAQQQTAQIGLDEKYEAIAVEIDRLLQEEVQAVDEEDAEGDETVEQIILFSTVTATGSFCISVLIGLLLANSLSRRVMRLKRGADSIADGNLSTTVLTTPQDEIGQLGSALNHMSGRLKESYGRLAFEKQRDEILLQSMGDGLVALDDKSNVALINSQAMNLLALKDMPQLIGHSFAQMVTFHDKDLKPLPPEQLPSMITMRTGQSTNDVLTFQSKDGKKTLLNISANPVVLDGHVAGAILLLRDVTKEKEVDRMKTEFISLASHQLRTPLSAIKWFGEMLVNGDAGELKPEQKDFAQNISDSTERMIELVNSLLNISRIESGRIIVAPKPTDLKELVGGIVSDLKAKTEEKQQTLVISVHAELPKINLDPQLIGQVYMNLLTNAIKYTPKNGEISVFISKKDDQVISQVTDNGYGIPKTQQDRIFQKFFRAENVVKHETDGTGLGLYLIKAIVESSGGKIWFESAEDKGTTFWFSLPLTGMKAQAGEVTLESNRLGRRTDGK